jgi:hypothetical protein
MYANTPETAMELWWARRKLKPPFRFSTKRRQFILNNGVALTAPSPSPVYITISSSIRRLTLAATARPSSSTPRFAISVAFASIQIAINHAAGSTPQWTSQEW